MLYGMHQHSQPTFDNIPFCSATGRGYSINSSALFLQERKRRMESPYYITTGRVRFSLRPESGELGHTPPLLQNFQLSSTFCRTNPLSNHSHFAFRARAREEDCDGMDEGGVSRLCRYALLRKVRFRVYPGFLGGFAEHLTLTVP